VAGDASVGRLVFAGSRLWNLHRPLFFSLNFVNGRSRAGRTSAAEKDGFEWPVFLISKQI
jgi:hypothetical protein